MGCSCVVLTPLGVLRFEGYSVGRERVSFDDAPTHVALGTVSWVFDQRIVTLIHCSQILVMT